MACQLLPGKHRFENHPGLASKGLPLGLCTVAGSIVGPQLYSQAVGPKKNRPPLVQAAQQAGLSTAPPLPAPEAASYTDEKRWPNWRQGQ